MHDRRKHSAATLLKHLVHSTIIPVSLLVVWEVVSRYHVFSPQALPAPSQVFLKWLEYARPHEPYEAARTSYIAWLFSGELPHDLWATFFRVFIGFLIGAGLALPLGLFMGNFERIYQLFNPLIQVLRPIPPIAYVPLSILWFGLGNPPAFFLISLGAFFPVLMNTISGVRNVDAIYIRAALNLGASRMTLFSRVIMPSAMPHILTGLRVGIGVAFICVIVAEMIAVNNGLGYRILEAREFFWSDKIIAGMITIGLLGLAIDTVMSRINNYLLRWHRGMESS
ncbi:MAG TPA: ABC transporter permease [Nitrospirota bacterium]|nr:ABC transporter permease [Nitrospirota bacterium]